MHQVESLIKNSNKILFNFMKNSEFSTPFLIPDSSPICEKNDRSKYIYLLTQGAMREYIYTKEGKEINVCLKVAPCMVLLCSDLAFGGRRKTLATSVGELRGNRMTLGNLMVELRKSKDVREALYLLTNKNYAELVERQMSLLIDSAQERLRELQEISPKIFDAIPLYHIASYLGMSPVTLSRIRGTYKEKRKKELAM